MKKQIFLFFFVCRFTFYVDRQPKKTDILSSSSSSSLFLPCTYERRTRRRSQEDKQKKMLFARSRLHVLFSKFLRAQKRVRISFRPKVLLSVVVFALKKDRRLSFRRSSNVTREKKKYTYARASWKNKNMCNRTSLGDDLVVVVWINVHRGRHYVICGVLVSLQRQKFYFS